MDLRDSQFAALNAAHSSFCLHGQPCTMSYSLILPLAAGGKFLWVGGAIGAARAFKVSADGKEVRDMAPTPADKGMHESGGALGDSLSTRERRLATFWAEEIEPGALIIIGSAERFCEQLIRDTIKSPFTAKAVAGELMSHCLKASGKVDDITIVALQIPLLYTN
jgi:hypothetical protein